MLQPFVRIVLRYGIGAVAGWEAGEVLAGDADVVNVLVVALAAIGTFAVEWWYARAKRTGAPT
jgi:hypothetical protein